VVVVGAVGRNFVLLTFFRVFVVGIDEVDEFSQFFPLDMLVG